MGMISGYQPDIAVVLDYKASLCALTVTYRIFAVHAMSAVYLTTDFEILVASTAYMHEQSLVHKSDGRRTP